MTTVWCKQCYFEPKSKISARRTVFGCVLGMNDPTKRLSPNFSLAYQSESTCSCMSFTEQQADWD